MNRVDDRSCTRAVATGSRSGGVICLQAVDHRERLLSAPGTFQSDRKLKVVRPVLAELRTRLCAFPLIEVDARDAIARERVERVEAEDLAIAIHCLVEQTDVHED